MQKPIANTHEHAELLTCIMRGDFTLEIPHPNLPGVMIQQPPKLNARMKAAHLLGRMQGDYFVKTETTIGVDYATELVFNCVN